MSADWMPTVQLPLLPEAYERLPRHPAYRYEYRDGRACLLPRPSYHHALLELGPRKVTTAFEFRPILPNGWIELVTLFAAAFRNTQPFAGLSPADRHQASRDALERTCGGGDGPWLQMASFQVLDDGRCRGAALTTLLPLIDPSQSEAYYWPAPPSPELLASRQVRPHLTWIFVTPDSAGRGLGTALLHSVVHALHALGYRELLSTFMIGNDASILWHWRNGFRLVARTPGFSPTVALDNSSGARSRVLESEDSVHEPPTLIRSRRG